MNESEEDGLAIQFHGQNSNNNTGYRESFGGINSVSDSLILEEETNSKE